MIHKSVITDFAEFEYTPRIDATACIHPLAAVIGNVSIGKKVFVSPFASVRGDEGQPIFIGDYSNIQDGVVIHGLETFKNGVKIKEHMVMDDKYSVYIGNKVSLAHQAQIHGPAFIKDDSFIGMQSLIFKASVGKGCVVEPGCTIIGAQIPDGRYVPAGTVLRTDKEAEKLPKITEEYPLRELNKGVVHVNTSLAGGYLKMQ